MSDAVEAGAKAVRLTTSTGSVYEVTSGGIVKKLSYGYMHAMKPVRMRAVPDWKKSHETQGAQFEPHLWADEHGEARLPEVGECLYIRHIGGWYLSTPVVTIEEEKE